MISFLPTSRWLRHGLFWIGITAYFLLLQWLYPDYLNTVDHYFFGFDYAHSPYFLFILFGYVLGVGMLYAYAFLHWVMPPLLIGRYGSGVVQYSLLTLVICYLFRGLKALHMAVLDPWLRHQLIQAVDRRHFDDFFVNQVYIHEYSTVILFIAIYKFFTDWQQKQQESTRLMRAKLQTEIRLLKTQVNPRFMVNSLTTLQTLIDRGDQQAPLVVLKLAHFLNYVLYESGADQVPLERDLQAMQAYIALEKERLGDQIDSSLNITGDVAGQFIAPLLWLPFLENAFHHSQTMADQAWLSLNLSMTGKTREAHSGQTDFEDHARFPRYAGAAGTSRPAQLKFSLANNAELMDGADLRLGNGLKTVRNRLDTHYPGRYELKLAAEPGVYLVVLTLQLDAVPDATTLQPFYSNS